jgi:signal transduction histidine kinase
MRYKQKAVTGVSSAAVGCFGHPVAWARPASQRAPHRRGEARHVDHYANPRKIPGRRMPGPERSTCGTHPTTGNTAVDHNPTGANPVFPCFAKLRRPSARGRFSATQQQAIKTDVNSSNVNGATNPVGPGSSDSGGLVNILIVDDEPRNLTVLETVLDDPGYRLVRAQSGSEALLALMAEEFAVLVLDVRMPDMSGFELAQLVKDRKKTARVPIIFLTAYYNEDQHILEGYGTGAVGYLHKPVNPAILRSKVAVFAELHKSRREIERANQMLLAEVAERRRAETRLSELNETLDRRVTERTTELQASEARLLEADRRKNEFLATLAHELRNPLAPMRAGVEVLRRKASGPPEVPWALDVMDRQVRAMTRMIEDLMDVSRINQGRIEFRQEVVDLSDVLDDAIETVRPKVDEARHRFSITWSERSILVKADRARLGQAFTNLLNNAAKYMDPDGSIEVDVRADDRAVRISIKDHGIGILPDRLEQVFEMFSQEDSALSRARGGIGIGLALTRRLVQMHEGSITAHSAGLGTGSEFVVSLPRAISRPAAAADPDSTGVPAQPAAPMRILIADDNKDAVATLSMLLEILGHSVVPVHDGESAVRAAADFDPQLILLDIGMPKLNGYETCRQIRAQPGGDTRILVAATGWGQPDDVQRSRDAGFDHHLVKPIDMSALSKLIGGQTRAA